MTFLGWLTIVVFAAILTALALPLGALHGGCLHGGRTLLDPPFRTPERLLYRVMRRRPEQGSGLEGLCQA